MLTAESIVLCDDELRELTGYRQPAKQLEWLRERGFWRACRTRFGSVVLERAHYESVCQGIDRKPEADRPRVRL